MALGSMIVDLQRAFAPLACRTRHVQGGQLGVRLVNGAGQASREYLVELAGIRDRGDLDAEVHRILAAIEVQGFSWSHGAQGQGATRTAESPVSGMVRSVRQALRRLAGALPVPAAIGARTRR